jgi:hypothetical protein
MGLYSEIPFLRSVVLTDLISNLRLEGELIGKELLPDGTSLTREVEWEVELGGRNIAPIVAYDAQSPLVQAPGIDRLSAEAVDIRQKFAVSEADILFLRQPGERENRMGREHVTRQLARMRGNIETRIEKMRWDALLTGQIAYSETVDGQLLTTNISFKVPVTQFVSLGGSNVWTDTTNAVPRTDFANALKLVREATGRRVKVAYMNSNTHALLDQLTKLRDDFRYVEGANDLIKSEHVTQVISNIRIVDYDEGYKTDVNWAGAFNYFLPNNKVVFAVGATDGGEKYGEMAFVPHLLADGTIADKIGAENWTQPDPTREYLRVAAAVIPRIFHPDWVYVLTVA